MAKSKTPEHVIKLIEKAAEEKAKFIDLGKCGLTEVPEEIVMLGPYIKEINFGERSYEDGTFHESKNDLGPNDFNNSTETIALLKQLPFFHKLFINNCFIASKGINEVSKLDQLTVLDLAL